MLLTNLDQTSNLNVPNTPSETETVIKSSNQKVLESNGFNTEFYQTFKKELMPTYYCTK